jgi:hypothetical protein
MGQDLTGADTRLSPVPDPAVRPSVVCRERLLCSVRLPVETGDRAGPQVAAAVAWG